MYDELGGHPGNTSAATCTRRIYEKYDVFVTYLLSYFLSVCILCLAWRFMANWPTQKVNSPTGKVAHATIDANFRKFPHRVRQTRAIDVAGKRSQTVVTL